MAASFCAVPTSPKRFGAGRYQLTHEWQVAKAGEMVMVKPMPFDHE
jgi:hypothetical protein